MDTIDRLFTVEMLATLAGAIFAVRLVVEYTKEFIDKWTAGRLPTFIYALGVSYLVIYGAGALLQQLGDGMWFAHLFNGFLIAVGAGVMQKKTDPPQQG